MDSSFKAFTEERSVDVPRPMHHADNLNVPGQDTVEDEVGPLDERTGVRGYVWPCRPSSGKRSSAVTRASSLS